MAKPKGYWDDIMKAARKAAAAGNDKVAKDLRRKADMVAEDALRSQRGLKRNIKEWDSRIGRFDYSVADEQQAKTVSARLREQARQRGLRNKSQKIGKKEEARKILNQLIKKYQEKLTFFHSQSEKQKAFYRREIYREIDIYRSLLLLAEENGDVAFYNLQRVKFNNFNNMMGEYKREIE